MKHCLFLLLALLGGTTTVSAETWSHWRGPQQNGVSRDRDLPDTFSLKTKENLLWRVPYGGITTPIVQNDRVYLINRVGEGVHQQERVMCCDARDGKRLWEHKFNVFLTDIVRDRLGWTQMVGDPETGNVYSHGTQGFLTGFDKDGKVLWEHSLTEEYGRITGYGGRTTSPIVDGDLLIIGMIAAAWGERAIGGNYYIAFDKRTGEVVWLGSTGHRVKSTYYSIPIVTVIGGQRLLISGGGDGGVHAFKVRTGEKVWSYIFAEGPVNCSPVVEGDRVYIGHGEGNSDSDEQGRVICLDAGKIEDGKPKLVWKVDGIKVKYASPVLHDGRLYVCNEIGEMYCLEAKTGKELWNYQYGKNTKGSPVWADGKIYITEVDSNFHILKPKDDGCDELSAAFFKAPGVAPVELNGSPAIVNGRIYFMTTNELVCVGKKDWKAEDNKAAQKPANDRAPAGAKPAHLQVIPADVTLSPGQSVTFRTRTFDDKGRLIGDTESKFSLAGVLPPKFPIGIPAPPAPKVPPMPPPPLKGKLSLMNGGIKLTVGGNPSAQFGRVVATVDGLTAYARVRVAPNFPYSMDFTKVPVGRTPAAWVNCQGKFAVVKMKDGTMALRKRNDHPSPIVYRAHAYIGLPNATGYTIEADVQGGKLAEMPDIGISANRYTLLLVGNAQSLRLVSWDALPRIDKTISFPWKSDAWYRMKLTVEVKGDKAIARGKVWPRGEAEPKEWTVTVEDPCPNREGAPALYANAMGIVDATHPKTESYFANVKITPNK